MRLLPKPEDWHGGNKRLVTGWDGMQTGLCVECPEHWRSVEPLDDEKTTLWGLPGPLTVHLRLYFLFRRGGLLGERSGVGCTSWEASMLACTGKESECPLDGSGTTLLSSCQIWPVYGSSQLFCLRTEGPWEQPWAPGGWCVGVAPLGTRFPQGKCRLGEHPNQTPMCPWLEWPMERVVGTEYRTKGSQIHHLRWDQIMSFTGTSLVMTSFRGR